MAETFAPRIYIDGYSAPDTSPFAQTGFSTDGATVPQATLGGWAQRGFSTDAAHEDANRRAFAIEQDEWS